MVGTAIIYFVLAITCGKSLLWTSGQEFARGENDHEKKGNETRFPRRCGGSFDTFSSTDPGVRPAAQGWRTFEGSVSVRFFN